MISISLAISTVGCAEPRPVRLQFCAGPYRKVCRSGTNDAWHELAGFELPTECTKLLRSKNGTPLAVGRPTETLKRLPCGPGSTVIFPAVTTTAMWCETGAIFLRCMHCGRRSPGWTVHANHQTDRAVRSAESDDRDHSNGRSPLRASIAVRPPGRRGSLNSDRPRGGERSEFDSLCLGRSQYTSCPFPASAKKISNSVSTAARRRSSSTRG